MTDTAEDKSGYGSGCNWRYESYHGDHHWMEADNSQYWRNFQQFPMMQLTLQIVTILLILCGQVRWKPIPTVMNGLDMVETGTRLWS